MAVMEKVIKESWHVCGEGSWRRGCEAPPGIRTTESQLDERGLVSQVQAVFSDVCTGVKKQ